MNETGNHGETLILAAEALGCEYREKCAANGRQPHVVTCCHCAKRFRWNGTASTELTCPACRHKFILLLEHNGSCATFPVNPDSFAEMICDWLGSPDDEEDELFDEEDLHDPVGLAQPVAA